MRPAFINGVLSRLMFGNVEQILTTVYVHKF